MENLSLIQSNLLSLAGFLILVMILLFLTWVHLRIEENKIQRVNREAWYAYMLVQFRKGCWIRDTEDDSKRFHITGVSEYDNEVFVTSYIYYPKSNGKKLLGPELWALDYTMTKLYLNEFVILEDLK